MPDLNCVNSKILRSANDFIVMAAKNRIAIIGDTVFYSKL
jgi:hypothetical protein